ncbi:DUF3373 family protein [Campylobacter troglodytis]|uniref:DUF3373 family protein n=1 Tax=Campylobacter troglodytis TaxID=654363 RepID=UPI001158EDFC|nr:DUF3373 family protein [Campylobacter troglodytis]TQR60648.1 DUF3373 domain-containing protein [Campylobacter troglodytis]
MKTKFTVATCLLASFLAAAPLSIEQRVAELEDRMDENEFQAGLDKLKFSLEFTVGVGEQRISLKGPRNQALNNGLGSYANHNKAYWQHNKWANELNLNIQANINDYTKFYGRLSMAKNWGMMDPTYDTHALDIEAGRSTRVSGQQLYVTRAYVDLFASEELVLTLGRQPGTEGPGFNIRNNALRQSTYPALTVNLLGDAAILTYKPSFLSNLHFALRGGYGKVYQFDEASGILRDWSAPKGDKADSNLYIAIAESKLPLDSIGLSNNLFMLSYVRLQDLAVYFDRVAVATRGNSVLAINGVSNLGTTDTTTAHFEAYNIFDLPLNYFGAISYMKGSDAKDVPIYLQTQTGLTNTGTTQKIFNEKNAWAGHIGLRYDFSQFFKLGAEYFYGSRYWYTMSRSSINDPLNLRATRGHAYDVYVISQIDRNQFFRLSYTRIQNKWTNRGLPIGGASSKNALNGYESISDSLMLTYNVKF